MGKQYRIEDVATPEAWTRDPALVLHFYDLRRRAGCSRPSTNAAHRAIAELERRYEVHVITQNIDDLHERAGSTRVMQLAWGDPSRREARAITRIIINVNGPSLRLGDAL
jgi:NAD-dependent deacetylase